MLAVILIAASAAFCTPGSSTTMRLPGVYSTNLYGPVPIAALPLL